MLAQFEKSIAFSLIELLEVENILVERDRFLHIVHFDGNVVTTVNLDCHGV